MNKVAESRNSQSTHSIEDDSIDHSEKKLSHLSARCAFASLVTLWDTRRSLNLSLELRLHMLQGAFLHSQASTKFFHSGRLYSQ